MRTSFLNFQLSPQIINYKKQNNNQKQQQTPPVVNFTGAQKSDLPSYSASVIPIFKNPSIYVQNRLISDGFDKNEIEDWDIYSVPMDEETMETGLKAFGRDYKILSGRAKSKDPLLKTKKPSEDIMAMSRIYHVLKKKFENEDTQEYAEAYLKLSKVFEEKFGIKTPEDKPIKDLILQTLSYSNRYNEPVVQALLEDKNFNNINIPQAIANIQTKKQAESAMIVLANAQQKGYEKDFSLPLAIMINAAQPFNIPAINKALDEQEFLIEDKDFTCEKLPRFLGALDYLSTSYIKDNNMYLQDVASLLDMEEDEDL